MTLFLVVATAGLGSAGSALAQPWMYVNGATFYSVQSDAAGNVFAGWPAGVVKLSGATGATLWDTSGSHFGTVLTLDSTGALIAGGDRLAKLDADTGDVVWSSLNSAHAVAVDASDNVVAAGRVGSSQFYVAKYDAADGTQLWRTEFGATVYHGGISVVVDPMGDVIAAGDVDYTFFVIKLAGATGATLWQTGLTGTLVGDIGNQALKVALDSARNVVAVGTLRNAVTGSDLSVVKLDGASGAELWRKNINGSKVDPDVLLAESGQSMVIDSHDDVIAAGILGCPHGTGMYCRGQVDDFAVVKLAGATGKQIWLRRINGLRAGDSAEDYAWDVAVDAAGDVYGVGEIELTPKNADYAGDFAVVKFAGATGKELWRRLVSPPFGLAGFVNAFAVAFTPSGEVIVGGDQLIKVSSLSGNLGPLRGKKLLVKDHATDATKRSILAVSADAATAPLGSIGDPILGGAKVSLSNPVSGETASFTLPAGSQFWRALGTPAGSAGYKYTDRLGVNGPCTSLLVRPRLGFTLSCTGKKGSIPFSLDEATQGQLIVSLKLANEYPQCMRFGGYVATDAGTADPGPVGTFLATNSPDIQAATAPGVQDVSCPTP